MTKREVVVLLDEYTDGGKIHARNRMQSLVSKIYNFGISRDVVQINPALGIDREPEKPRERVLSDDELSTVLGHLGGDDLATLGFRLLLLTGQRPNEVFGMRWAEIDGNTWTLPAQRSKNKRESVVPLSQQARYALQLLRSKTNGHGFVFPSPKGSEKPFTNYAKAGRRLKKLANLAQDWRVYDLKSTCLTGLEKLGTPAHVVEAVANHAASTVTRRHYALHDYLAEKREALALWGSYVDALDPSTVARVITMQRRGLG
ncbi:MAG: site-specific integrase [Thermoanaerobaculia bacterium]|nr:site-specific integrase [Thermoanaerobaculia bacterium]